MRYYGRRPEQAWSKGAGLTAAVTAAAIVAAGMVASRPTRLATPTLALAGVAAIGLAVVIGRCRMPAAAKAVLLAAWCAALLTTVATQDLFGLRRVEAGTGQALAAASAHAADRIHLHAPVARIGAGDAASAAAAADVAHAVDERLAGADVGVAATLTANGDAARPGYRLSWTLTRSDERLWCGVFTTTPGAGAPRFAGFGDRVAAAAGRSRGRALNCG